MTIGIYGIFNAQTNECLYVGMSKNIEDRWKSHLKLLRNKRHRRKDFVEWYHSNGAVKELLSFRVLETCECDNAILNILEIKWFNEMGPKYYGKKPSLNEKWEYSENTKNNIKNGLKKNYFEIQCNRCDKMFFAIKSDTLKCLRCRELIKNSDKVYQPKTTYCKYCEKEKIRKSDFCSDECKKKFHNNKCLKCDSLIEKEQKFCSRKCYLESSTTKGLIEYDDLYQMYVVEGMSTRQIALKTGYSNVSVQRWLRSNDIQVKSNAQTISDSSKEKLLEELPDRNELLKYYNDRLSFDEIGKIYNTNRDKVRKWVKHYGFPSRKRPHRLR